MDAATEKKEVVMVTDDVLTIKDKFQEEPEGFPVLGAMRKKERLFFGVILCCVMIPCNI